MRVNLIYIAYCICICIKVDSELEDKLKLLELTFTRGICIPLAGNESRYFLRSWFKNSKTK